MEPATTLPSDDEPWWQTVEEFDRRLAALVRVLDWSGAERLAAEYYEKAESAYEAALYAQSRATSLGALGRDAESLEASELAERLAPLEPHFKIQLARRLIEESAQPQAGLSKLRDAEPLLEPSQRGAWLGEKGLGLLALGRDAEAVECFRELAGPERLTRMREWDYIGLVDFRLVTRLVKRGLVPDLCIAYLEAAEAVAAGHNADHVEGIRNLIELARAPRRGEGPVSGPRLPDQRPPLYYPS